jgi:DNA-binding MarR family transcriptional regulator
MLCIVDRLCSLTTEPRICQVLTTKPIRCIYTYMSDLAKLLAPTQDCTCSALRRASRALTAHYERHFRGSGIRGTQFTVLSTVIQTGGISVTALAELMGMERTTLTRTLRLLEDAHLIKLNGTDDGRVRTVTITTRGENTVRKLLPRWQKAQASARDVLNALRIPAIKELAS